MRTQTLHCHTTLCDGQSTAAEMAAAALRLGLGALGFSGHAPLPFPNDWAMDEAALPVYRQQVLSLREQYRGRLEIFLGLEQDILSPPAGEEWDYRIGSVHCVEKAGRVLSVDESAAAFRRDTERFYGGDFLAYARDYYRLEGEVVRRTGCQVVGHFDLITKFNEGGRFFDEADRRYRAAALEALDALLETEAIFEVNTGAMSRGYRTAPYPAPFLLRRIRERGGRIVVTSDSHSASTLTCGYRAAAELARSCGFRESMYLTEGGFQPGPLPEAQEPAGNTIRRTFL